MRIPRLVSPLHSAAAADLRNRCRDRCTGGVECSPAGHISPALEANAADIHTAYRWGPSQSHMATANPDAPLPIFLAFQPYVRSTPCPCACQDAPTALVRAGGVGGGAALAEGLHLGGGHGAGLAPDHRLPRVLRLYIRLKRRRSDDLKCLRALGGNLVHVNGVAARCIVPTFLGGCPSPTLSHPCNPYTALLPSTGLRRLRLHFVFAPFHETLRISETAKLKCQHPPAPQRGPARPLAVLGGRLERGRALRYTGVTTVHRTGTEAIENLEVRSSLVRGHAVGTKLL